MITVYLDMDGVLANFKKEYESNFGTMDVEGKEKQENWKKFVDGHHFEKLEMMSAARLLLNFVEIMKKSGVNVEILTSTSVGPHDRVEAQKRKWLKDHEITYKFNAVPGGSKKAAFANDNSILVDDTEHVVERFRQGGGHAVLHKNSDVMATLTALKKFMMEKQQ